VLEAATQLFTERGIDASSMDAIAAASGVSKATIYKHWPDKDALALEVLSHVHGLDEDRPSFNSGDIRTDLVSILTYEPAEDRRELKERLMPHLMAYAIHKHDFGDAWRKRVVDRVLQGIRKILERGIEQGALVPQVRVETGVALLFGPVLYQYILVSGRKAPKPPVEFAMQVVDAFLRAFGTEDWRKQ
jgi:AcrR family transcriptional regulator